MNSETLKFHYKEWKGNAKPEQIKFVDDIYKMAEDNYDAGGSIIVEAMSPQEVLDEFKSKKEAKEYCGLNVEQATNCRWGEDSDPEIETLNKFREWKDS